MTQPKKAAEAAPRDSDEAVEHKNVHQAIVAVMRDVKAVNKDGFNTNQRYDFRGIDGVLNAVGPALRKHGVFPTSRIVGEPTIGTVPTKSGQANSIRAVVEYTFHGPGGPDDTVSTQVVSEQYDSGDKHGAKMMSVALRVALIQILALPTHQKDPDMDSYERATYDHADAKAKIAAAKTKEQGLAVFNRAQASGADPAQLQELTEAGSHLASATEGIEQS